MKRRHHDFSSKMPLRKIYTAAFKLEAVAYAKKNGNRATGRHFSINEKMTRNWRKQEDELRLTKKSKRANRGQKARWPALEDKIETWVLERYEKVVYSGFFSHWLKVLCLKKTIKHEHKSKTHPPSLQNVNAVNFI
jgi:transposase-like protein